MKIIIALDEHDSGAFLAILERCAPVAGAEVLFAHVVDSAIEEQWTHMAGHHWFRRHPAERDHARFTEAARGSAQDIVREAMHRSAHWPETSRRSIELHGNPERELVRLALVEQADLVAVGQHRGELGPHALGRCARFVIDHAPCPVLLIRTDELRAAGPLLLGDRLNRKPKGPAEARPPR